MTSLMGGPGAVWGWDRLLSHLQNEHGGFPGVDEIEQEADAFARRRLALGLHIRAHESPDVGHDHLDFGG